MDLFGDLPDPVKSNSTSSPKEEHPGTVWGEAPGQDFFSDLPPPQNSSNDINSKGIKRKPEDSASFKNVKKATSGDLFGLQAYSAERKGEREEMQDAHLLLSNFHKDIPDLHSSVFRLACYAVFDGHGGTRASRFAAAHLSSNLAEKICKGNVEQLEKDIKKAFLEAFRKTDEDFLKQATKSKPSWKDGTTAAVVLVINNTMYIANLGDSKAILCRYQEDVKKHIAVPLTKDHSPTSYEERMRIQKAGGYVRDGRVMGVLEVSRSIGDGQYKTYGVISVPDVRRCQLTPNDTFILIACDGLWKVFTSEEVIRIVLDTLKDDNLQGIEDRPAEEIRYEAACSRLANEAVRKLSGDNVTVIIVSIRKK